ncbi:nucleotidyltransferase family protein [Agrobacterium tumefaciens]|uniref:nucleotidyltransferase family protein n=1 Tax=Agrobacterium tumefaciens TaxID=358 RepID=UPI003013BA7E
MTFHSGTRPRSRDSISVTIILLAAGEASRMGAGGPHKLLAEFAGVPLVRRSAERAISSSADSVTVVTGYRQEEIKAALAGLELNYVHNPEFASGLASSLKLGFGAPKSSCADGVLVMLADMPNVTADHLTILIETFRSALAQTIVRASSQGKPGNPVILPMSLHQEVTRLEGDVGARHIIEACSFPIIDVAIGSAAALDVDTPEEVIAAGGILK